MIKASKVTDSRNIEGFIWRRRKDLEGNNFYSLEMSFQDFKELGIDLAYTMPKKNKYILRVGDKTFQR